MLVCRGKWCDIFYAVRADGTPAPALEVMTYLQEGSWEQGHVIEMHCDEQVDAYASLMALMKYFADHGEGDRFESMNGLGDGLFEFKAGRARIAFYDTPGDGTYESKVRVFYQDESGRPDSATWHIPDLDQELRLCSGWPKKSQTAKPSDIGFVRRVRQEDLSHDRN